MTETAYFQDFRAVSHKICDTMHRGSPCSLPKILKMCPGEAILRAGGVIVSSLQSWKILTVSPIHHVLLFGKAPHQIPPRIFDQMLNSLILKGEILG